MASERNYGNTSRMDNIIRSRYSTNHSNATYASSSDIIGNDCISCQKNKTGKIPTNNACKLICGTTTSNKQQSCI